MEFDDIERIYNDAIAGEASKDVEVGIAKRREMAQTMFANRARGLGCVLVREVDLDLLPEDTQIV
jgi:hypothetical protein